MRYRFATESDLDSLADWNQQLIRDEGHRNRMTVPELRERMNGWIQSEYKAVIFDDGGRAVAYALYRETPDEIHLRQLFVARERRREGLGRRAMAILFDKLWPKNKRLVVEVLCKNAAAIAFWRAMGYADYALTLEIMPEQRTSAWSPDIV